MLERALRRLLVGLLTSLVLAAGGLMLPLLSGAVTPAVAQISAEFQEALEPYGHWARSARFGEVWLPDDLPPDWRPYEYGHWVYTDEWGWYWISDPEEEDWGWVVYHYGRWAFDRRLGWFWIPGDEWAPAWVDWRYGGNYVGWAPLPPDELIEEYDEEPTYWVFVAPRYLGAPRWRRYMEPPRRRDFVFRNSHVVNRTLGYGRGRAGINAGVSPTFIARASRAAMPTYRVSPRVVAGTQGVAGAVRVTSDQLHAGRAGGGQGGRRAGPSGINAVAVQQTTVVHPAALTAAPQPLGKGERGKLGSHPPRAAQGVPPPQQQQQPAGPPPQRQQQVAPPAPPSQPPIQRQQQTSPRQPQITPSAPAQQPPPPPQPERHQPPPAKIERPIAPQTPPAPQQQHEERREPRQQQQQQQPAGPPHPAPLAVPQPQPPAAKPTPAPAQQPPPPPPPQPERHQPPPAKIERPITPQTPPPPPPQQQHEERREPRQQQQQQQPAGPPHPALPAVPQPQPPAARPAPPPQAAKPPPPKPAAKPAPKPGDEKNEPPK